jgi:hypothetical protein
MAADLAGCCKNARAVCVVVPSQAAECRAMFFVTGDCASSCHMLIATHVDVLLQVQLFLGCAAVESL